MSGNERGVFTEAMRLLDDYNAPPAMDDAEAFPWWEAFTNALLKFSNRWYDHPLAVELSVALHAYLEIKAKAKGGKQHEN